MNLAALRLPGLSPRNPAEVAVVVGVVCIVAVLVLPMPAPVLDVLLATSMAVALLVLVLALGTSDALEFSVFPTLLLLLTLYRLALNVSSTRLILGDGRPGRVIEAFGSFVIGGNYAVGLVIFLILIAINFIVITKGAGRVAEVAARFTLDAMPGRQMSIDADLSAGLIDEDTARRRREEISRQADFYGAMDGAAKFVRGDAIAGLLITAINLLGGLFVGTVQLGMTAGSALSTYAVLTVGDGLVSQIPALVVSTAAGIIVTHSSETRVSSALITQLGRQPQGLWVSSGFLALLGMVPGLPPLPFLALAAVSAASAWAAGKRQVAKAKSHDLVQREPVAPEAVPGGDSPMRELLQIEPVELEVGYGLIPLVDESQGGDLLERVRLLRKQAAQDLGILVPPIRIRDDVRLQANEYVIKLRGIEIGRWEMVPRHLLALDAGAVARPVEGLETVDPSFGMPARWIGSQSRVEAESSGYIVVEPATVVATHLMESLKRHAADLLGRQDVQELMDLLKQSYPALVEEIVPAKIPLGVLHRVLQRLLRESVPIRDLVTILEALADMADQTKDPEALTEHVRQALSGVIAETFADETGTVNGITVGPKLEAALMGLFSPRQSGTGQPVMDPGKLSDLLSELVSLAREHAGDIDLPPLISPPGLRVGLRRLVEPVLPRMPVLSLAELPAQIHLQSIAIWEIPHET